MKPIWKILITTAVIIGLVMVLLVIPHYRAKGAVNAYRKQLKRQGEKMTIAELTPVLSADDANNGRALVAAASYISPLTNSPPMMRWLAPGHALVGWAEAASPTENSSNCWPDFKAAIEKHPDIAEQIAVSLKGPGLGFSVDYQQGFNAPLAYLSQMRKCGNWLGGAATLALHEGDTSNAWKNLKSETDLVRMNNGEPLLISQIVRAALVQTALSSTWEALQYPGWSDDQLAQLQANWDSFNLVDQCDSALSMERAMQEMTFAELRTSFDHFTALGAVLKGDDSGYDTIGNVLANPIEGVPVYFGRHPRYWMWKWRGSYDEEIYAMKIMQAALETIRSARTNDAFIPALDIFDRAVTSLRASHPRQEQRFVFADSLVSTVPNYLGKAASAETERRMAVTAIALSRYRLRLGKYPAQLRELAPDYLPKIPIDFMDGKPLRYGLKDDGMFLLYSVGEDGKDNGGDASPQPTDSSTYKSWYKMRDAVWPSPATPEEVNKYEADMLQKAKKTQQVKPVRQMPAAQPAGTNSKTN